MKKFTLSLFAAIAGLAAMPASASDFDGSRILLCASIETFGCAAGSDCVKEAPEDINVPQFFRINFKEKLIRAKRLNGEEVSSKIVSEVHDNGEMILQGVQNQLGWSMAITEENGKMSLTASGDQVAFTVFGACTPLQ